MNHEELDRIWTELSMPGGGGRSSGLTRRRIMPGSPVHMFLCVVWPSGGWGVLIEGRAKPSGKLPAIPESRGMKTTFRNFGKGGGKRASLLVQLELMEFRDLFSIFVSSLLEQLSSTPDDRTAFGTALEYIGRWQRMMEGAGGKGLSKEAQRGLLGELHFLERSLLPLLPAVEAISCWLGPTGAHQDFVVADIGAEVKTTITKRHSMIRIQSEKQLDDSLFGTLFLVHIRIDEFAAGVSLDDQIKQIRSAISSHPLALAELNLKLAEYGYKEGEKDEYEELHYSINELRIYRVVDDFPRITENELPEGVGDLNYTIVADTLQRFLISDSQFIDALRSTDA